MNLLVKAKRQTAICTRPADIGSMDHWIYAGDQLKVVDQKKVGLETYYITDKKQYVNSKDVVILRDNEYYYSNYNSRKLMRSNMNLAGGEGLGSVMENNDSPLTPTYNFLQLFSSGSRSTTSLVSRSELVQGSTEMARGVPFPVDNTSMGGIIPNSGSKPGTGGTVRQPTDYGNSVLNQDLGAMIGTKNSTVGSLIGGITVGSVLDGSFTSTLASNALGLLTKWGSTKLNHVVGFGAGSNLSNLFRMFGIDFNSLFGRNMSNVFGGMGTSNWTYGSSFLGGGGNFFTDPSRTLGASAGAVDAKFREYFRYKGCNGQYIIEQFADQVFERPAYYDTPQVTMPKGYTEDAVKVINEIWNYDGNSFNDPIKKVREEFNLDIDRQTIVTKFNRYRVPTPDNELIGTRGHIFFTQPDLNLSFEKNVEGQYVNYASRIGDLSKKLLQCHPILMKYLCSNCNAGGHGFIPILTHAVAGLDISDDVLETTEHGETYMGWKQMYATSNIKSKTAGTVSIKFIDDEQLSVYKMIKLWVEYMNAVYHGEVSPKDKYRLKHELDYAISIYYFVTKYDDTEIAFWSKFTGAFPVSVPSSSFSDQLGQRVTRPEYNITWAFARKEDYRPIHLAEFNNVSADAGAWDYMPTYNPETTHVNKSFVGAPYVEAFEDGRFYQLRFRPS